jgi:dihydropteroate synthase
MGILNVAPDSFYKESRSLDSASVLSRVRSMIDQGADIIDIGGYSSRPGAESIPADLELSRVRFALEIVRKSFPDQAVSLDTFRAEVARVGIEDYDVDIINDISGGTLDKNMFALIAEKNVPYILMHMQGRPDTMQNKPVYSDIVNDLILWFTQRINVLRSMGVNDIIIDPGFGFGKNMDHNYSLMAGLNRFEILDKPLLVGVSRKSMIWKALGKSPEESLGGTIVLNTLALSKGANIIRVHDVDEAVDTVKIYLRSSD